MTQKDSANPYAFFKGEDYCLFANSTDEQRVAAWLLIKFMSADENNIEWLVNSANLPMADLGALPSLCNRFLEMLEVFHEKSKYNIPINALFISPADLAYKSKNLNAVGKLDIKRLA